MISIRRRSSTRPVLCDLRSHSLGSCAAQLLPLEMAIAVALDVGAAILWTTSKASLRLSSDCGADLEFPEVGETLSSAHCLSPLSALASELAFVAFSAVSSPTIVAMINRVSKLRYKSRKYISAACTFKYTTPMTLPRIRGT